tara:strand:- start:1972 stop:2838 length:867 start_codon:yes stop_codon:yes gene_type:complete
MNYHVIYKQLIVNAHQRALQGYYELHHITPKCMGGNNSSKNLVKLTAREHFIAHRLLSKIYPNVNGLHYALWSMSNYHKSDKNFYKVSSRLYEQLKKEYTTRRSKELKGKPTGKKPSKETIAKGQATKAKNGNTKHTEEAKAKISAFRKGRKFSEQERAKRYPNNQGHIHSQETKRKISEAQKGKTIPSERITRMLETRKQNGINKHTAETKAKISAANKGRFAGIPKPKIYKRVCKICLFSFMSGSSLSCICIECKKPRVCSCGCGHQIKAPGKYIKNNHAKNIKVE